MPAHNLLILQTLAKLALTMQQNLLYNFSSNNLCNVMLVTSNLCGSDTIYQQILVQGLVVESINSKVYFSFYPNPFSNSLVINFDLNKSSMVTIKVYDLIGNEVSLIAYEMLSPKSYIFKWENSKLREGVCLLNIKTENHQQGF